MDSLCLAGEVGIDRTHYHTGVEWVLGVQCNEVLAGSMLVSPGPWIWRIRGSPRPALPGSLCQFQPLSQRRDPAGEAQRLPGTGNFRWHRSEPSLTHSRFRGCSLRFHRSEEHTSEL